MPPTILFTRNPEQGQVRSMIRSMDSHPTHAIRLVGPKQRAKAWAELTPRTIRCTLNLKAGLLPPAKSTIRSTHNLNPRQRHLEEIALQSQDPAQSLQEKTRCTLNPGRRHRSRHHV